MSGGLTHIDSDGRARMVDVSDKPETARVAVAEALVTMETATLDAIVAGTIAKGEVLRTAELAGVMAAKRTGELIPLCHPLPLSSVSVTAEPDRTIPGIRITSRVSTVARTGVEMEALTAATIAALTIYDMAKALDRQMVVGEVRLLSKSGGRSGDWVRR